MRESKTGSRRIRPGASVVELQWEMMKTRISVPLDYSIRNIYIIN